MMPQALMQMKITNMETNDMVEWKKLGEICVSLKKEIIKQDNLVTNGKYPVVNSGVTLYGRYNEYNNVGNAFTFASRGEYAGFLTYMSEDFWRRVMLSISFTRRREISHEVYL